MKCASTMEYDVANAKYAGVHQATSEALRDDTERNEGKSQPPHPKTK